MKNVKFKECNTKFAEHQDEYDTLDALRIVIDTNDVQVVTCWGFSWKERFRILFGGKLWLSMLTFGNPLQPLFMSTERKEHFTVNK